MSKNIIFIDGDCSLCSRFVRLVIKFDKKGVYKFYPFTNDNDELKTIVVLENENLYSRSKAISLVLQNLNFPFFLLVKIIDILPRIISDRVYDLVANNRNDLFGSYCIPVPQEKRINKSAIQEDLFIRAKNISIGHE